MEQRDSRILAEVHLLGLIAEGRPDFEAALDAAVSVGLVPEDERATWLGWRDRYGEPDAGLGGDAAAALALLERMAGEARSSRSATHEVTDEEVRFVDALETCLLFGVIDEREFDEWERRGLREPGDEPELQDEGPDVAPSLVRLRGVYPAGPATWAGAALRIVCVECYDDGILVRWHARDLESGDAAWERALEIGDDLGTAYAPQSSSSGWTQLTGGYRVSGETTFDPAPPPAATRLQVRSGDAPLELDLTTLGPGV